MTMTKCQSFGIGLLVAASLVGGCSRRIQRTFEERVFVTGMVTVNGSPLPEGEIVFESSDDIVAGIPPGSSRITEGQYRTSVSFGTKTVRISSRVSDRGSPTRRADPAEEAAPPDYKEAGRFEAAIEKDGPRTFDFDISSAGRSKKAGARPLR